MSFASRPAAHGLAIPSTQHVSSVPADDDDLLNIAKRASQKDEATIQIIIFLLGLATIGTCLGALAWLAVHGPALVRSTQPRYTDTGDYDLPWKPSVWIFHRRWPCQVCLGFLPSSRTRWEAHVN
jgi:hypothetical protein